MSKADKIKDQAQQAAGKAKEWTGAKTGNEDLERAGRADQAKAKAKKAGEHVKDAAKDAKGTMTS